MKKQQMSALVLITCIFAAFTAGFFLGRNLNHNTVQISAAAELQTNAPVQLSASSSAQAVTEDPAAAQSVNTDPTTPLTTAPQSTEPACTLININTATHAELVELPGIGDVLAQRIIDYRETYGTFQHVQELTNVSGIGTKRLEAILDLITVGG